MTDENANKFFTSLAALCEEYRVELFSMGFGRIDIYDIGGLPPLAMVQLYFNDNRYRMPE